MNNRNHSRWLALKVIDGNTDYSLSYVSIEGDEVTIMPFAGTELPATSFYSGTIRVVRHPRPHLVFE